MRGGEKRRADLARSVRRLYSRDLLMPLRLAAREDENSRVSSAPASRCECGNFETYILSIFLLRGKKKKNTVERGHRRGREMKKKKKIGSEKFSDASSTVTVSQGNKRSHAKARRATFLRANSLPQHARRRAEDHWNSPAPRSFFKRLSRARSPNDGRYSENQTILTKLVPRFINEYLSLSLLFFLSIVFWYLRE